MNSCPVLIRGCGQKSELFQPKQITAPEFFLKHKISLSSHINMSQEQGKPRGLVRPDSHRPNHPSCLTGRRNSLGPLKHLDLLTDSLLSSPKFNLDAVREQGCAPQHSSDTNWQLGMRDGLLWNFLFWLQSHKLCPKCPLGVGRHLYLPCSHTVGAGL